MSVFYFFNWIRVIYKVTKVFVIEFQAYNIPTPIPSLLSTYVPYFSPAP